MIDEAYKEAIARVKDQRSMADVVQGYGIRINRSGFCKCPFHSGDNTPSMKIYKKDYHCFACGANGDLFSFVQQMEGCDFKGAFEALGGSYEIDDSFAAKRRRQLLRNKQETMRKRTQRLEKQLRKLQAERNMLIDIKRENEPYMNGEEIIFPDVWCEAVDRFEYIMYQIGEIQKEMKEGAA